MHCNIDYDLCNLKKIIFCQQIPIFVTLFFQKCYDIVGKLFLVYTRLPGGSGLVVAIVVACVVTVVACVVFDEGACVVFDDVACVLAGLLPSQFILMSGGFTKRD